MYIINQNHTTHLISDSFGFRCEIYLRYSGFFCFRWKPWQSTIKFSFLSGSPSTKKISQIQAILTINLSQAAPHS
ncbi:unnamed protein product [Rhizophagus irregularis]|nr:unnamed protein product [Rhizophagus irregularis]CAB5181586.1 unnamed protein product [Rhizophagus irregularis]